MSFGEGFDLVGQGQLTATMNGTNLGALTADFLEPGSNALMAAYVIEATGDMEVTANGTGVDVGSDVLSFLPSQEAPQVAEVGGTEANAGFNM